MPEEDKLVSTPRARLQDAGATEEEASGPQETTSAEPELVGIWEQRTTPEAEINRRKQEAPGAAGNSTEGEEGDDDRTDGEA